MIYLHKILPIFLLPTGISLILLITGLALRRTLLCWLGVVLLCVSSTPIVSNELTRAAEGWQVRRPISTVPAAEAIVVLGAGRIRPPGDRGASEWADANRFFGGIELYKAGKAPLLIFTGGWLPWQPNAEPEGDVLTRYAMDLGVPRQHILTTGKVVNTYEESRAVAALLKERANASPAPRVLLVTSAFHMRRARLLFAAAGVETEPFPVSFRVQADEAFTLLDLLPSGASLSKSETALREFYGLAYYHLIGG
jgi:uncharacterized SAM-binding protein YcdF (DUF218 family)